MDRKNFIKKVLLTSAASSLTPNLVRASRLKDEHSTHGALNQQVGFNHLPNKEIKQMNTVLHKANTRGRANHGWLDSRHTFSFANYHNPERMNFGVLRVLNDDHVAAGKGFPTHPHSNMEIISIPLEGDLEHKDSIGNNAIINEGDVQVMSAGTGISHSEFNKNQDKDVKFLQIWVFPNKRNVSPRYDQISIKDIRKKNQFYQILSPNKEDQGVWIHQDAWFYMGDFDQGKSDTYTLKEAENGVYVFILDGTVEIGGTTLEARDGMGIWDVSSFDMKALEKAQVLLMEVPMK